MVEGSTLKQRILDTLPWTGSTLLLVAVVAWFAHRAVSTGSPDFEAMLVGCTAGRLPGAPWTGVVGALLLSLGVGALAVSRPRGRIAAVLAASCGPLVFASVESWMSLTALTLQVAALAAFAQRRRRTAWGLAVAAAWTWPPASLIVVALAVGEFDRARHQGSAVMAALLAASTAGVFAAAAALPAWVMRTDSFLPVLPERGLSGVARVAELWLGDWPRELTVAAVLDGSMAKALAGVGLVALALVSTFGLVRVLQRARQHEGYAALRLAVGLALWTLILTGALGLGRGSWGSTQAMLHVVLVLLVAEGGFELAGLSRGRAAVALLLAVVAVGWSAGLYFVAQQWAVTSPFLH